MPDINQTNKIFFSLIMATYGRQEEVRKFLLSLSKQTFNLDQVELIIVDQNDESFLDNIIACFSGKINIVHVKSNLIGLSINRNIGLDMAKGKIVAFPDDDCTYYADTLQSVCNFFENHSDTDIVLGKIYHRGRNKNMIRNWEDASFPVTVWNFFKNYSSITIFSKNSDLRFSEKLGAGQYFGSYEDADYIYRTLKRNKNVMYTYKIQVMHPDLNKEVMSLDKIWSYGLGFGAFVKKNRSLPIYWVFCQVIVFHFINMLNSSMLFNKQNALISWSSLASRLVGYKQY